MLRLKLTRLGKHFFDMFCTFYFVVWHHYVCHSVLQPVLVWRINFSLLHVVSSMFFISAHNLLFWLMRSMVWPQAKISLCLWHVRKSWAENAIKKISNAAKHTTVLQMLGDIMYGKGCNVDDDPIDWALDQLDNISNTRPLASAFMQCSKLKPSYEFHFEGLWNFSIAIEGHI